jgi:hypothetical protein
LVRHQPVDDGGLTGRGFLKGGPGPPFVYKSTV